MRKCTLTPINGLKIILLLFFFSSLAFATADGPDYLDIRNIAPNDELKIYLKPDDLSKLIGTIPHNAICIKNLGCVGTSNWWCKVDYQEMTGWANGQFLKEGGDCSSPINLNIPERTQTNPPVIFEKHLLDGKTIHNKDNNSYVKLSFIETNTESFDGEIIFTFLETENCLPNNIEQLHYRLKKGRIIYYAHDGSKTRLTLRKITPTSWIVLEEEDIDGDERQFDFGETLEKVYEFKNHCVVM